MEGTSATKNSFHQLFIMSVTVTVTTIVFVTFLIVLGSLSSIVNIQRAATTSEARTLRKRSFSQILSPSSPILSLSVTKWEQQQQRQQRSRMSQRQLLAGFDHGEHQPNLIRNDHEQNHNYFSEGSMNEKLQLVKEHVSTLKQMSALSAIKSDNLNGMNGYESYSPFPRWDVTTATSSTSGSSTSNVIDSLLDFVEQESAVFVQYPRGQESGGFNNWIHTSDIADPIQYRSDLKTLLLNQHNDTIGMMSATFEGTMVQQGTEQQQQERQQQPDNDEKGMSRKQYMSRPPKWWFPETLYVVQADGIYCSQRAKDIAHSPKYKRTEQLMNFAHSTLVSIIQNNQNINDQSQKNHPNYWPRLTELLFPKNDTFDSFEGKKGNSFPFLAHYGDYLGCNYRNWNEHRSSLPVLP